MRRRLFIVFNPAAGRQRRRSLDHIIAAIESRGAHVTLNETTSSELAASALKAAVSSDGFDAIVAAGGDGTVRQAASVLANTAMPLGYIPLGTGNVLAHELGVDHAPDAIAKMLVDGPVTTIDLASANGEPFVLMAGMGFDGRVVAALDHTTKNRLGKIAYAAPAVRALAAPLDDIHVTIDDVTRTACWVVVANASHYAGQFIIAPRTDLRVPGLSVVLFRATTKPELLGQLTDLALGRLGERVARGEPGIEMRPATRVVLTASRPLPLQLDGDAFGEAAHMEIKAAHAKVRLITP